MEVFDSELSDSNWSYCIQPVLGHFNRVQQDKWERSNAANQGASLPKTAMAVLHTSLN